MSCNMIEIRTVSDLASAEKLWRLLSPRETIFDEWDFRFAFYKYDPYPLGFLAAYEIKASGEEEAVALMPLEKHPEHGWEFFAEDPGEENKPFVRTGYEGVIPDLYAAIPAPAKCFDISGTDEFTVKLPLEDYKYILPLETLKSWDDYLEKRLSPKKRRVLRADLRKVEAEEPQAFWGRQEDLGHLFALNQANFSDSYLQTEAERGAWSDLLRLPYDWQISGLEINGRVVAAALAVFYNHHYIYLINGAASQAVSGLGKYLNKVNLERALSLGADYWDAGLGDCNWKEFWHLYRVPQYKFIKSPA